jgi:hypothetical protein
MDLCAIPVDRRRAAVTADHYLEGRADRDAVGGSETKSDVRRVRFSARRLGEDKEQRRHQSQRYSDGHGQRPHSLRSYRHPVLLLSKVRVIIGSKEYVQQFSISLIVALLDDMLVLPA